METMKTIKARKDYISGLLDGDGTISDEDQQNLRIIFKENYNPPNGEDKFQDDEIKKFYIARHPTYKSKCIYILLEDGFISTMGKTNLRKELIKPNLDMQRKAFRYEIDDQIKVYREKGMEVDHNPPFYIIRDEFLKAKGIDMEAVKVVHDPNKRVYTFEDRVLASEWYEYHYEKYHRGNGKLEAVTPEENQRRLLEFYWKNSNTSDSSAAGAPTKR